ncbi:MAG: trypsin-like serine protease [Myxococcales bacterium]|nr:trypsin-like serine protease [Myxococcales bacterium]
MRRSWPLLGVLVALGCDGPALGERAPAIVGGVTTAGDPAVVGVVIGGEVGCSGVVIDPRVVITAAHCAVLRPSAIVIGTARGAGGEIAVATALAHPDFGYAGLVNDLGLLILADDAPPPLVPRAGEPPPIGAIVRLVGFGATSVTDLGGIKHEGLAQVTAVSADELSLAPDPASACHGDSGGAVLADLGGGEALVGVISSGDAGCVTGQVTRIDVHRALIDAVIVRAHRAGALGAACWSSAGCALGACAAFAGKGHGVCAPTCAEGCPDGWRCVDSGLGAGRCQPPGPVPGTTGAVCADDLDCVERECLRADGDDLRCWPTCVGTGGTCTNSGGACVATDRVDVEACVPEADGGCATGGGGDLGAALALLGLARRRARPRA